MSVAELLWRIARRGYRVRLGGGADRLVITPKPTPDVREQILARKPEIVAYLRSRDLRKRRWMRMPAPCAFYCGPPEAGCWRCGGAWLEHPPQSASLAIGDHAAPREAEVQ